MKNELKLPENTEIKASEVKGYKKIKPENGTTYADSKEFWNDKFSENSGEKVYYDDNGEKYRVGNELEPNATFEKNGYTYNTDNEGRVVSVEGKLQLKDHDDRANMPDDRDVVARGKMLEGDHRGHLIADRFNGSGELENLVPMDAKLNTGDYAKLENTLAIALENGADVKMKVEPVYKDDSNRPDEIRVSYSIDGDKEVVVFKNGSDK